MTTTAPLPDSDAAPAAAPKPAAEARLLVRRSMTAALATLDQATAHPYASLVLVATMPGGAPLLLISQLARHTRNLTAEPRASLLFDGTGRSADPLAGGRVTLIGRMVTESAEAARRRFLARHPSAETYVDFADFAFYRLDVERAHYVGGFGRIVELPAAEVLTSTESAEALLAAEAEIVAHMNMDHADAVGLYATNLAGESQGPWRMAGIDPDGADLIAGARAARLVFPSSIATPGQARRMLADLAHAARGSSPGGRQGLT